MNDVPLFEAGELDPLEPFDLDDREIQDLLLLAARKRRMDPTD